MIGVGVLFLAFTTAGLLFADARDDASVVVCAVCWLCAWLLGFWLLLGGGI
jgi:hypothetical protein